VGPLSGIELRERRATSWTERAEGGLDTRFIFLWIAFNALYGQAHYRKPDASRSEIGDIRKFLAVMSRIDRRIAAIPRENDLRSAISELLADKYLHDCCWKVWDAEGVRSRPARELIVPGCNEKHDDEVVQVFKRLYVLRKQLFHGCSTDGSTKNRPSLRAAVPVLARFVRVLLEVLKENSSRKEITSLLGTPPYPPTDDVLWNAPRVNRRP
jgi:hypothetical protein